LGAKIKRVGQAAREKQQQRKEKIVECKVRSGLTRGLKDRVIDRKVSQVISVLLHRWEKEEERNRTH